MKEFKTTLQEGQADCGVSCLDSIIRYYGGDISKEVIREYSGTSTQGTTLLGLYEASIKLGFHAEGLEAESVNDLIELKKPVILHVLNDEQMEHYVIYWGYMNEKAIIGDPAKGIVSYNLAQLDEIWNSKYLLSLEPGRNFQSVSLKQQKKIKWLYSLIKEDIKRLSLIASIGTVIAIMSFSTVIFTQKLIDDILPISNLSLLVKGILILAILLFARIFLAYWRGKLLISQNRDFNSRINENFYGILMRLPKFFFDTRNSGDIITRINDARKLHSLINTLVGSTLIDFFSIIATIAIIFTYSGFIALISVVFMSLFFLVVFKQSKKITKFQREILGLYGTLESNYIDTIGAITTIKSTNRINFFEKLIKSYNDRLQTQIYTAGNVVARFSLTIETISVIFSLVILIFCSFMIFNDLISVGKLVAIVSMSAMIAPVLIKLSNLNSQIQEAKIVVERMFEFVSIKPEFMCNQESNDRIKLPSIDLIKIENLSFQYKGQVKLIEDISLEVRNHKITALVGESGSGKSTILQLLIKFYSFDKGKIIVNRNINFNDIPIPVWRESIAYVPQNIKIFSGTVAFNICLCDSIDDLNAVTNFCKDYGLQVFFDKLHLGLMTPVGGSGVNLSGGQIQLVGIARALYSRPKILLLDEVTSSMDSNSEEFFLRLLQSLKNSIGIFLVTHKFRVAKEADIAYVIENGSISDVGHPLELVERNNFFKKLSF